MLFLPGAVLFQLPAVNNVTVENEFLAGVVLQKFRSLLRF